MRKLLLSLAAVAAFGIALPVATNSASAETVIIKKDRGYHHGWRHNHRADRADRVVIVKKKRHHHYRTTTGAAVIVR